MRNALLNSVVLLLPCASATAAGWKNAAPEQPRPPGTLGTVTVLNQTDIRVDVTIDKSTGPALHPSVPGHPLTIGMEPGSTARFDITGAPYRVIARSAHGRHSGVLPASRDYTALGTGECSPRITVTKDVMGPSGVQALRLSDAATCGPDDPPDDDPGLPPAAALWRESLLAALCSGGLMGLVAVGMLINRQA